MRNKYFLLVIVTSIVLSRLTQEGFREELLDGKIHPIIYCFMWH